MNDMELNLAKLVDWLQSLYGMPAVALILLSGLVVAYALRFVPSFPNGGIPVAVILWCGILNPVIASADNNLPLRIWLVKNVLVGLVIGLATWFVYGAVLRKLEKKLLGNGTALLAKEDVILERKRETKQDEVID